MLRLLGERERIAEKWTDALDRRTETVNGEQELGTLEDKGYYLVYPEQKQNSPLITTFEHWLVPSAQKFALEAQSIHAIAKK